MLMEQQTVTNPAVTFVCLDKTCSGSPQITLPVKASLTTTLWCYLFCFIERPTVEELMDSNGPYMKRKI